MSAIEGASQPRRDAYCVLSARSLPYARLSLSSLLARCLDDLNLRLITDDESDRVAPVEALATQEIPSRHQASVHAQAEIDELAPASAGAPGA